MTSTGPERELVVFALHGEYYALPIATVREIIRYTPPSATAAASGPIQGMINLRGLTLPVVDLSPRLGRTLEIAAGTRILVVELGSGALGLIVDTVDGIMRVPDEKIQPLPAAANRELGDQVAAVGERLIVLIDPELAFGDLLPKRPAVRRRRTSTAKPRASS